MWDGAIVSSGLLLNNLEGWRIVASESGWDAIYLFANVINAVSQFFDVNYVLIHGIFISLCLLLICYSTALVLNKVLTINSTLSFVVAAFIPLIPVWNVTLSSGVDAQIFYLAIGLWGTQLFLGSTTWARWVGFAAIILSFEYSSLVIFIPVVAFVAAIRNAPITRKSIVTFLLVSISGIVYFLLQKTLTPPKGRYSGYNSFYIDGWQNRLNEFSTFLVVDFVALVILLISVIRITSLDEKKIFLKRFIIVAISSVLLFGSSCLPHVFVGKSVTLERLQDWEGRYALTLAVSIVLILGLLLDLVDWKSTTIIKSTQICILSFLTVQMAWLSIYGFAYKINQQFFFNKLIQALEEYELKVPAGLVSISGNGIPGPDIRSYEYNLLFQQAYKDKPFWFVGSDIPVWPSNEFNYYYMDVFFPSNIYCQTQLNIDAQGYIGNKAIFNNIATSGASGSVEVSIVTSYCD